MTSTHEIAEQLGEALAAFVERRVADPDVARDLVQDVYERIHRREARLEELERVDAWVFRVARNVITDHYRRRGRSQERERPLLVEPTEDAPGDEAEVRQEVAAWLPSFVAQLPEPYREVLELTELQGLTQAQAAERLGLSVTAVKSRVRRGRAQLEKDLRGCCHIELDARGTVMDYAPRACPCCD
ncbi:MAG: RNA polymerase sigma factor SigZ [Myxococcales bacterium]|nr:RNA polymerase sigma factor SigZ [Myxococcales bacterium]